MASRPGRSLELRLPSHPRLLSSPHSPLFSDDTMSDKAGLYNICKAYLHWARSANPQLFPSTTSRRTVSCLLTNVDANVQPVASSTSTRRPRPSRCSRRRRSSSRRRRMSCTLTARSRRPARLATGSTRSTRSATIMPSSVSGTRGPRCRRCSQPLMRSHPPSCQLVDPPRHGQAGAAPLPHVRVCADQPAVSGVVTAVIAPLTSQDLRAFSHG